MDGVMIQVYRQKLPWELAVYQVGHNSVADGTRLFTGTDDRNALGIEYPV